MNVDIVDDIEVVPSFAGLPDRRLFMSSMTARPGAGSGEVPGRTLSLRLPAWIAGCGSFMACVLAGCRGGAWLKKGLLSSE
jgi:hypothetical protein